MASVPSWLGRCAAWAERCRNRKILDISQWKQHDRGFDRLRYDCSVPLWNRRAEVMRSAV
ncbi:hypothetical protein CGCSCA5_v002862 [Colletotrichum siamense]|nr:hypothetical protein CGCSCA5_v002862 [Colletotrichum siamense]